MLFLDASVVEKGIEPQLAAVLALSYNDDISVKLTLAALEAVHIISDPEEAAPPTSLLSADNAMLPGRKDVVPLTFKLLILAVPTRLMFDTEFPMLKLEEPLVTIFPQVIFPEHTMTFPVTFPNRFPVKFPLTIPNRLPVKLPLTFPISTLPVKLPAKFADERVFDVELYVNF